MKLFTFTLVTLTAFVNAAPNSLRSTQSVAQEEPSKPSVNKDGPAREHRQLSEEEEWEYNKDEEEFQFDEDEEEFDDDEFDEDEEGNKVFKTRAYHGKKYYFYNNKVCRTHHGGVGKEGYDYIKVHSYSCKATCDKYSWCKGYEQGPHGHCELWKYSPQKVASKHGYKCAVTY